MFAGSWGGVRFRTTSGIVIKQTATREARCPGTGVVVWLQLSIKNDSPHAPIDGRWVQLGTLSVHLARLQQRSRATITTSAKSSLPKLPLWYSVQLCTTYIDHPNQIPAPYDLASFPRGGERHRHPD